MEDKLIAAGEVRQRCERLEKICSDYVSDYELDDGESCYSPNDPERQLIEDAVAGLTSDEEFVAAFNAWQDAVRERYPEREQYDAWLLGLTACQRGATHGDNPFAAWNKAPNDK